MATDIQQARDVFADAGISASGDSVETQTDEVIQDDAQIEVEEVDSIPEEQNFEPQQEDKEDQEEVSETLAAEEAPDSYTPETMAEAIGFTPTELYESLNIPMDDGTSIPLGEIKNKYTEIGRENGTLKSQVAELNGKLEMAAASGGAVGINNEMAQINAYINQLQQGMNTEEMNDLKEIDPTRYLIAEGDNNRAINQALSYKNQLNQKQQIDNKATIEEYNRKAVELVPAWSDPVVMEADQKIMTNYMVSMGFDLGEISKMGDPRTRAVIKELIDLRAEKSAATEAVKKVRKAPKVISNSRLKPVVDKTSTVDKIVKRQRTNPSKQNELAAAKAVWNSR